MINLNSVDHARVLFHSLWPDADWESEHLQDTAMRFVKMMTEVTTPIDINWKDFPSDSDEMVIERNIPFSSLCAHHLVPFMGVAHVAYIPSGRVCGLSKLARVVQHCAASLTVQEDLTTRIAEVIHNAFTYRDPDEEVSNGMHSPIGIAVVLEAEHLCMTIRGVKAPGTKTITSCMRGVFADHARLARTEFLHLVRWVGA